MSYIYKIINNINKKVYVGATTLELEIRFKYHVYDSTKRKCRDRALYKAMGKYGVENFSIELIEEVEDSIRFEREIEWIEKLRSFKDGYNETFGGEGRSFIDCDLVISAYTEVKNISEVSRMTGYDEGMISTILKKNDIDILSSSDVIQTSLGKCVGKFDLDGTLLGIYPSTSEAEKQNKGTIRFKIADVCRGNRKTHKGFRWKYL